MGMMSNFIACDYLRKNEYITEENPNNNKNTTSSLLTKATTNEGDVSLNYIKSGTINSQLYFDGKIDVKDYIQQLDKESLEDYQKIKRIGKGSYSSVYKVKNKNSNLIRAMKIIPKNFQKDNTEIMREIEILKNLDHPNVMKIYEFLEDDKNYYIIEEFCDGGDLDTALDNKKIYCEFLVKFIMYQVFLAVNYLHSNKIVHQDIKKKNISIIKFDEEKENKNAPIKLINSIKKIPKYDIHKSFIV